MAVEFIEDTDGAEIRVETGVGVVERVETHARNLGVWIRSDNRQLRDPITGWLDMMGLPEGAHPQIRPGARIEYRIHVVRKPGVDREPRIADLRPREKVRDLVRFRILDAAGRAELTVGPAPERGDPSREAQERPAAGSGTPATAGSEPSAEPSSVRTGPPAEAPAAATLLRAAAGLLDAASAAIGDEHLRGRVTAGGGVLLSIAAELEERR